MPTISAIAHELNRRSFSHPIGHLQEIRKDIKGFRRLPGSSIFTEQTIGEEWAFHHGGRSELQFNIGFDGSGGSVLRHGVAFSFETSQTLPDIGALRPKVQRFNEFHSLFPKRYADMQMWHWDENHERHKQRQVGPIPQEMIRKGVFVVLGRRTPIASINYKKILDDFDSLLSIYRFVESSGGPRSSPPSEQPAFVFRAGCREKPRSTIATQSVGSWEMDLTHNEIQHGLYKKLCREFGTSNVGTENQGFSGTSIDLVVRHENELWFYEIKTSHSPRACLRDAIGQLLEYSFWPGARTASKLVVVGRSPIDQSGENYLSLLRSQFSLPLFYEHFDIS